MCEMLTKRSHFGLAVVLLCLLVGCGGGQSGANPDPTIFSPSAVGFVANVKSDSVASFLLDETTGALVLGATAPVGQFPGFLAITPDHRFLFVSNIKDGTISRLALDGNGGMQSAGSAIHLVGPAASGLAIPPSGRFLFVGTSSGTVEVFSINQQTGDLSPIPGSPFVVGSQGVGINLTNSGQFLYAGSGQDMLSTFAVDSASGTLTLVDTLHTGFAICAVAFDPSDKYLFANACEGKLLVFRIQPSGTLQETTGSGVVSAFYGVSLAITPDSRFVYMDDSTGQGSSNLIDNAILGYSFDAGTGAVTPVPGSPFLDGQSPSSVAVSPAGSILVSSRINPGHVASYRIDSKTGALTPISGTLSDSGVPTGNSPNHVLLVRK